MPRTRSAAKKDKETWDAVAKDMKKKGANYRKPGDMTPPPPRMAPKPPNKRTGPDFLDQKPKQKKKNKKQA